MSTVPSNVSVFYGQVDKRAKGWYWADGSEKPRGSIRGPFDTKEQAVENAIQRVWENARAEPKGGLHEPLE